MITRILSLGRRARPWGEIPPPSLPEEVLRLEPRLRALPENVILRLLLFKSGRGRGVLFRPWIPLGCWSVLLTCCGWAVILFAWRLGAILLPHTRPIELILSGGAFISAILLPMALSLASIKPPAWMARMAAGPTPVTALGRWMDDIVCAPVTAEDFALAHWGSVMVGSRFWRSHPAWALLSCSASMKMQCELAAQSSPILWASLSPRIQDSVGRYGILRKDSKVEDGYPFLGNQIRLSPDTFDYTARFDFLVALWREYLETCHLEAHGMATSAMR